MTESSSLLKLKKMTSFPFQTLSFPKQKTKPQITLSTGNPHIPIDTYHHPSQIQSVANTLIFRSHRVTKPAQRQEEIERTALKQNCYSGNIIRKAIKQQNLTEEKKTKNNEGQHAKNNTSIYQGNYRQAGQNPEETSNQGPAVKKRIK